jgi:3',5'-cyclic AMP phosphodiesterase CpdA
VGAAKGKSMRIGIVHVSDIHLRAGNNPISSRVGAINAAIRGVAQDISDLLLIVTGDIAYSGKQEEYAVATDFLGLIPCPFRN